jgi:hypothetical protein
MDELSTLASLKSVPVFGLAEVFTDTFDAGVLQVWYPSIDIHSTLLHVTFEDGLSISVLKNRATCHKIYNWKS